MKIRTAFVSNSSSSSYLILTSKENHEAALATLNDEERKLFEIFAAETMSVKSLFGRDVVYMTYVEGSDSEYLYESLICRLGEDKEINKNDDMSEDDLSDILDSVWTVVEKWKAEVYKNSGDVFADSIDL